MSKNFLEFKKKYNKIFEDNKELECFIWSSFTPHGGDILFQINLLSLNNKEYSSLSDDMKIIWKQIFNLLTEYNNGFFSSVFGNNVMIAINRNDYIIVDEYEEFF
jgi:hypothetical protein